MDATTATANCPECGMPAGDCYNICPLSPNFYSPQQEREDEANWSRADYDRECGYDVIDPAYEQECADAMDAELAEAEARGDLHPASSLYDLGSFVHPDDAVDPSGQREVRAGAFADEDIPF